MKKNTISWLALALLLFANLGACTPKSRGGGSHADHDPVQKADVYTCPMHPRVEKDQPGQCPICGMNLIKLEGAANQPSKSQMPKAGNEQSSTESIPKGHAGFSLPLNRIQMIGVKLGVVENKALFKAVRAAGRLAFDPELYTAQSEYIQALKQKESVNDSPLTDVKQSALRMVDSAKLRLKILGISDKQIESLSKSEIDDTRLLLNKSGGSAWVYAEIHEMDLPLIRPGLSAGISAGFLEGQTLVGTVVSIDRMINPLTRTAKARIVVSGAKAILRPESYVDVDILAPLGEQLTVPFDSVFDTGKEAWVFIANGKGNFEPRLVTVKFRAGDEVALAAGVKSGEQIVTSANFLIDSESRLRGAMMAIRGEGIKSSETQSAPSCPTGQHWDAPMKMCMPDIGD